MIAAAFAGTAGFAQTPTQNAPALDDPQAAQGGAPGAASPFILEPDAQLQGDRIKQETFRSQPAGQNKNWNLDIGRFQAEIDDQPNTVAPDPNENYSGMRLRLPLRGGLGN